MAENTMTMPSAEIADNQSEVTAAEQNVQKADTEQSESTVTEQNVATAALYEQPVNTAATEQVYNELCTFCDRYNKAAEEGVSKEELEGLKKEGNNIRDRYNGLAEREYYTELMAKYPDKAVEIGIKTLYFEGVTVKYKKNKSSGVPYAEIDNINLRFDLENFVNIIGDYTLANPKDCLASIGHLAYILANFISKDIEAQKTFRYNVNRAAKAFKFPDDCDPTSKKKVVQALQYVVDTVLFIPKKDESGNVVTDDKGKEVNSVRMRLSNWNTICHSMTEGGNDPGSVGVKNMHEMCKLVVNEIYIVLNNKYHTMYGKD